MTYSRVLIALTVSGERLLRDEIRELTTTRRSCKLARRRCGPGSRTKSGDESHASRGFYESFWRSARFLFPASAQAQFPDRMAGQSCSGASRTRSTQMDHLAVMGVGAALAIAVAWPLTAKILRASAR